MRRLLALLSALAISLTVTADSHAAGTNLAAHAASDFGCGKRMTSDATYFADAHAVVGASTLSNNCQLLGFHSAVVALLSDANGRLVAYGEPHRHAIGARGPCLPFIGCPSTLVVTANWTDTITAPTADRATQLTLVQDLSPNSLLDSLISLHAYLDQAIAIGKAVAEVATVIGSF
jgi:hypothetical protein